ncbi:MAG: hypothetical protein FDZ69_03845 [Deltaproteobacteria bacterium]|nr:MAG: hypothetical protein FDZ69_03845 [Deltaproteobacteria bacterium]
MIKPLRQSCAGTLRPGAAACGLLLLGALLCPPPVLAGKWGAHVDLTGKLGNERSLQDTGLFLPVWQDDARLLFLDLRLQHDDDSANEGNFGIGARRLSNDWIAGGYAFYDRRESAADNRFHQLTLGGEVLTERYDARLNLYLADGDRQLVEERRPEDRFAYAGSNIVHQASAGMTVYERALSGGDFEVGGRIPGLGSVEARGYLGGYYFDAGGVSAVAGPRGRVEVRFPDLFGFAGSSLDLGGEVTHDRARNTDFYLTARLRIPLGGGAAVALTPLERRMTERIQRDPDIVVAEQRRITPATGPRYVTSGGVPVTVAHVDAAAGAGGDGSRTAPYGSLAAAAASGDSIILLHAGSVFAGESVTLAANQRLLGESAGAAPLIRADGFGAIRLPRATVGTARPVILAAPGDAVTVADGSEVAGLLIDGPAGAGIAASGLSGDVSLHDLAITGTGGAGIALADNSGLVTVRDVRIDGTAGDAIAAVNSSLAISGARIGESAAVAGSGIAILADSGTATSFSITGSTIRETWAHGLTVEVTGGSTITAGTVSATSFASVGLAGDGIDRYAAIDLHAHDGTVSVLRIDNGVTIGTAAWNKDDPALPTLNRGIALRSGDEFTGEAGSVTAVIDGITVTTANGLANIELLALGNGSGRYTVTGSRLFAEGSTDDNVSINTYSTVVGDTPSLDVTLSGNRLRGAIARGVWAASDNNSGTLLLDVTGNTVQTDAGANDGIAVEAGLSTSTDSVALYLARNDSSGGLGDGYFLYCGGGGSRLTLWTTNAGLAGPAADTDNGVIAGEGNLTAGGAPAATVSGPLQVVLRP